MVKYLQQISIDSRFSNPCQHSCLIFQFRFSPFYIFCDTVRSWQGCGTMYYMSPQASLEVQRKCGSFLQESNCATFLNQHIESRFIYTSIFFVCMMFTGIPDFSLWLCRQGSTHAQDNRTSLGMFCRGLTQICSQESSPQKIVVNTQ